MSPESGRRFVLPTNSRTSASSEQQSSSQEFAVWHGARPTTVPDALPRSDSTAGAVARVNDALGLTGKTNWRKVKTPVDDVVLRRSLTPHMIEKRDQQRERYANRILPTLEAPDEVWMTWYDNGQFRKRYVKVWDDNRGSMSVVTEARDGSLLWNFIPGRAKDFNRQREGVLLYPRQE